MFACSLHFEPSSIENINCSSLIGDDRSAPEPLDGFEIEGISKVGWFLGESDQVWLIGIVVIELVEGGGRVFPIGGNPVPPTKGGGGTEKFGTGSPVC